MSLENLIGDFKRARGVGRYVHMNKIREYFKMTHWKVLVDEINRISEPKDLDILIGVGMKGILWSAVVGRRAYLEGV